MVPQVHTQSHMSQRRKRDTDSVLSLQVPITVLSLLLASLSLFTPLSQPTVLIDAHPHYSD